MKTLSATLLSSVARTATPTAIRLDTERLLIISSDRNINRPIDFQKIVDMHIIINVTATNLTPSVQVSIEGFDEASSTWYSLLSGISAITATGRTVLRIGATITAASGLATSDLIPAKVRLSLVHADADSITYSVGINWKEV